MPMINLLADKSADLGKWFDQKVEKSIQFVGQNKSLFRLIALANRKNHNCIPINFVHLVHGSKKKLEKFSFFLLLFKKTKFKFHIWYCDSFTSTNGDSENWKKVEPLKRVHARGTKPTKNRQTINQRSKNSSFNKSPLLSQANLNLIWSKMKHRQNLAMKNIYGEKYSIKNKDLCKVNWLLLGYTNKLWSDAIMNFFQFFANKKSKIMPKLFFFVVQQSDMLVPVIRGSSSDLCCLLIK